MSVMQTAQVIIDAGEKATPGPWVADPESVGHITPARDKRVTGACGNVFTYTAFPYKERQANTEFSAIARQSPEVSRALLRAVALMKKINLGISIHNERKLSGPIAGPIIDEFRAFLAEINKETT